MSAPSDSKPFRFLELLPELRLKVYSELFLAEETIWLRDDKLSLSAQFLRTCRLVHDEGVAVLYGDNAFDRRMLCDSALEQKIGAHNVARIRHLKESSKYEIVMFIRSLEMLKDSFDDQRHWHNVKHSISGLIEARRLKKDDAM